MSLSWGSRPPPLGAVSVGGPCLGGHQIRVEDD